MHPAISTRRSRVRFPWFLSTTATLLIALFLAAAEPATSGETSPKKHFDPIVREIEGWKVHIDPRMVSDPRSPRSPSRQ
jgi:hypothetical protein